MPLNCALFGGFVIGFRCYDNIAPRVLAVGAHDSIAASAKCQRVHACTRSMPGLVSYSYKYIMSLHGVCEFVWEV